MIINHTQSLAAEIASPASIEGRDTYEKNSAHYNKNNFTYIPMPFENTYFDRDEGSFYDLEQEQYLVVDNTIRRVLDLLIEHPFLLVRQNITLYKNNNKIVLSTSQDISDEDEWTSIGTPSEAFENFPKYKSEILDICKENSVYQIITLADINRRAVKETLYPVIAELESRFVNEIRNSNYEPSEFYSDLSPETIGRWIKAKNSGLEMHISEYMKLSEMLKIIGKSDELREKFNYSSRNQFDKDLGGLVGLRNKIMHASRTLVSDKDELTKLVNRVSRAESVIEAHGGQVVRENY